jgi:hypothetical protein
MVRVLLSLMRTNFERQQIVSSTISASSLPRLKEATDSFCNSIRRICYDISIHTNWLISHISDREGLLPSFALAGYSRIIKGNNQLRNVIDDLSSIFCSSIHVTFFAREPFVEYLVARNAIYWLMSASHLWYLC